MQKTYWNASGLPTTNTLDGVMLSIRNDDMATGLLYDAPTLNDVLSDVEVQPILDGIVVQNVRLKAKSLQMKRMMNRVSDTLKVLERGEDGTDYPLISAPFMRLGSAQVAVMFPLSDGQVITAYFHNPDITPKQITGQDVLVSFKFLLNKKDITIVVAPERGQELNAETVAKRIMMLADKNSAAFQRQNAKAAERKENIARLTALRDEKKALLEQKAKEIADLEYAKSREEADRAIAEAEQAKNVPNFNGTPYVDIAQALEESYSVNEDFWKASIGEVQSIPDELAERLENGLEDANFHYERYIFKAKRLGLKDVADILESQQRTGGQLTAFVSRIFEGEAVFNQALQESYNQEAINSLGKPAQKFVADLRAVFGYAEPQQEQIIELSGNEFGEFDLSAKEGKVALREKARQHIESLRGKWVHNIVLDQDIEIRSRGIKKTLSNSANPKKLQLIAAIEQILKTAKLGDNTYQDNYKSNEKPNATHYFHLRNSAIIDGNQVKFDVIIEKDKNGALHYDLYLDEDKAKIKAKADMDSVLPEHNSRVNIHNDFGLLDNHTLNLDNVQGGYVLNLFFLDEDGNVIPDEDEVLPEAEAQSQQAVSFDDVIGAKYKKIKTALLSKYGFEEIVKDKVSKILPNGAFTSVELNSKKMPNGEIHYNVNQVYQPTRNYQEQKHQIYSLTFSAEEIIRRILNVIGVVTVTGNELGDFDISTEEGKKALREAAFNHLVKLADDGDTVFCKAVNAEVGFNKAGAKKFKSLGANPIKNQLAAAIKLVIQNAELVRKDIPSYDTDEQKRNVTYSVVKTKVAVNGEEYGIRTVLRKLEDGQYQYDVQVKDNFEMIMDSVNENGLWAARLTKSDVPQSVSNQGLSLDCDNTTSLFDSVQAENIKSAVAYANSLSANLVLDNVSFAKADLTNTLGVLQNNLPISVKEGNFEQAKLESEHIQSIKEALITLDSADDDGYVLNLFVYDKDGNLIEDEEDLGNPSDIGSEQDNETTQPDEDKEIAKDLDKHTYTFELGDVVRNNENNHFIIIGRNKQLYAENTIGEHYVMINRYGVPNIEVSVDVDDDKIDTKGYQKATLSDFMKENAQAKSLLEILSNSTYKRMYQEQAQYHNEYNLDFLELDELFTLLQRTQEIQAKFKQQFESSYRDEIKLFLEQNKYEYNPIDWTYIKSIHNGEIVAYLTDTNINVDLKIKDTPLHKKIVESHIFRFNEISATEIIDELKRMENRDLSEALATYQEEQNKQQVKVLAALGLNTKSEETAMTENQERSEDLQFLRDVIDGKIDVLSDDFYPKFEEINHRLFAENPELVEKAVNTYIAKTDEYAQKGE